MSTVAAPAPRLAVPARRRVALAVAATASIAGAVIAAGPSAPAVWLGVLGPDLALLAGMTRSFAGDGRLAPRAVPAYNAVHALPGPVALAAGAGLLGSPVALGGGLAWLAHVLADRAVGYGLRTRDGWQRG